VIAGSDRLFSKCPARRWGGQHNLGFYTLAESRT
jgi:hypothetical protein